MGRIVQLSKNVINQIAAGEVVERPFSVVKELVENSIDAGATRISVEVSNECRDLRVADNGTGIHPDDIILAFNKHATSKIQTGEDLYNVTTMGFRGEALASIISISKLTCITRTKDFDNGYKVTCANSEVSKMPTGCAVGTIMEIRDLFYNLPARLKFLKSAKTEFSYIQEFMQSIMLIHPEIAFELKFNGKTTLKTKGINNQLQTIKELFSDELVNNLKPVNKTDAISEIKIVGYVSSPNCTRSSKKDYYLYVNSRLVKCPVFQKAIDNVYRNLIGNTRYPFLVLNLILPPSDVDVNVHPAKREVRYKNPNQIFNFIYTGVNEALKNTEVVFNENNNKVRNMSLVANNSFINDESDDIYVPVNANIAHIFSDNTSDEDDKNESSSNTYVPKPSLSLKNNKTESVQKKFVNVVEFKEEDIIIGQYKKTYILIEREDGLEIVDQHIAEERYIYECLKKNKNIDSQILFLSDVIEISPSDKVLLENNKDKLNKFGYEIDFISDKEAVFRKVPQILSKVLPKEIMADILENIAGEINNIEEKILISTSCKAAVKANTYLNIYQMQEIIKNWRKCENPQTCPHGRPIAKFLPHKEVANFFMRNE